MLVNKAYTYKHKSCIETRVFVPLFPYMNKTEQGLQFQYIYFTTI